MKLISRPINSTFITGFIIGSFILAFGIASQSTDQHWLAMQYLSSVDMDNTEKARFAEAWAAKSPLFLGYKFAFQAGIALLIDLLLFVIFSITLGKLFFRQLNTKLLLKAGVLANVHYILTFVFVAGSVLYLKQNLTPLQLYSPINIATFAAQLQLSPEHLLWSQLTPLSSFLAIPLMFLALKNTEGQSKLNCVLFILLIFCVVQLLKFEIVFPFINEHL